MTIEELYKHLSCDQRLQKNWERNQPRVDRALEAPLIARTPREVATAALLAAKMRFEPEAARFVETGADDVLVAFAVTQGNGGRRLANIITGKREADSIAKSAAMHSLRFYRDRHAENPLVRLPWSDGALRALASADGEHAANPALRPTGGARAIAGLSAVAALLLENTGSLITGELRERLRAVPGLGPERADAVGVFAFGRAWPITDEYLWRLLRAHDALPSDSVACDRYDQRQKAFDPLWQRLLRSGLESDPNELAATLYLWADEAARYGFVYPA